MLRLRGNNYAKYFIFSSFLILKTPLQQPVAFRVTGRKQYQLQTHLEEKDDDAVMNDESENLPGLFSSLKIKTGSLIPEDHLIE